MALDWLDYMENKTTARVAKSLITATRATEQGTRIADGSGISDDAWADALLHINEDEVAAWVRRSSSSTRSTDST